MNFGEIMQNASSAIEATQEQQPAPQEQVRGIPQRVQINFDTWKKIKAKGLTGKLESIIDSAFLGIETPELREIVG